MLCCYFTTRYSPYQAPPAARCLGFWPASVFPDAMRWLLFFPVVKYVPETLKETIFDSEVRVF